MKKIKKLKDVIIASALIFSVIYIIESGIITVK